MNTLVDMDTERYASGYLPEYNGTVIQNADNKAEYAQAVLVACKPWLQRQVQQRRYRAIGDFYRGAYSAWKAVAGPTTRGTRATKLAVTEILRRTERALYQVVREGQEHGEIGKQGEMGGWATKVTRVQQGPLMTIQEATGLRTDQIQEMRRLTGELDDEAFEAVIAKARIDGEMSRAKLARIAGGTDEDKEDDWVPGREDRSPRAVIRRRAIIRAMARDGQDSRQMEQVLGTNADSIRQIARSMGINITADRVTSGTKHIRADRVVGEAVGTLEGVAMSLDLASPWELDPVTVRDLRLSMNRASRRIAAYIRELKEVEEKNYEYADSTSPA